MTYQDRDRRGGVIVLAVFGIGLLLSPLFAQRQEVPDYLKVDGPFRFNMAMGLLIEGSEAGVYAIGSPGHKLTQRDREIIEDFAVETWGQEGCGRALVAVMNPKARAAEKQPSHFLVAGGGAAKVCKVAHQ
jgi:hypothetical protein